MSIITIEIEGLKPLELERCRQIIHKLFEQGAFNVRNGKVILNFDSDGIMQQINFEVSKWRRNKESLKTLSLYENANICISNN